MENVLQVTDERNMLMDMTSAQASYSSFVPQTMEEKATFFNAVNSPAKRMKEMINTVIKVKHVYAETVDFINQETGETAPGIRIVFIDDKGVSYQAASKGIFSSVKKLFSIYGTPDTWEKPLSIKIKEISKGVNRNVLVFEIA